MELSQLNDTFHDLGDNVKKYVQLRLEILKCIFTEALAKLAAMMLKIFIFSLLIFFIMFFLSFSFVFWYDQYVGPLYVGALIITGFYVLIGLIVYFMRRKIFLDPLIKSTPGSYLKKNPMKKIKPTEIKSLTDLRLYRQELELEAFKTEVKMQAGFSDIADALSPRNLISAIVPKASTVKEVFLSAVAFGRKLISRKKNKKKKKNSEEA